MKGVAHCNVRSGTEPGSASGLFLNICAGQDVPTGSKVGYPDRKYLPVTLFREEAQCPDVHLDAMMEMVLAAHTDATISPE